MGPATLTYGKKGRLRSAFGSIRRGGSKKETDKKTEDPAFARKPTGTKAVLRKRSLVDQDTIDKLADELLDSSTPSQKSSTSISPSSPNNVSTQLGREMRAPTSNPNMNKPSARTSEPKMRESGPATPPRTVTSRTDKRSSWTSPSASRVLPRSPKRKSEAGFHRPPSSAQSMAVNQLVLHPTLEYGAASEKPLKKARSCRKLQKSGTYEPAMSSETEPAEVKTKIHAMLAATESLKSDHTEPARTRRASRSGKTNVLGKMSEVWDRLHSRSPDCESDKQINQPTGRARDQLSCFPVHGDVLLISPLQRTVSNRSIRINEGNNLNGQSRHKVQRMMGSIPDDQPNDAKTLGGGKGKAGGKTSSSRRTPAPVVIYPDVRNRHSYVSSHGSYSMLDDHFMAESSFEDNLERGILRTSPIGSSTPPRVRVRRLSVSSSRYSTDQSPSNLIYGDLKEKTLSKKAEACQVIQPSRKPSPTSKSSIYTHASLDPTTELGQHFDAFCRERAKKHPSPSKEELEVLEVDLMKLSRMKSTTFPIMEPDELSAPAHPINPLRSLDPNKLVTKQQLPSRKRDSTGSIKDSHPFCSSPDSRLPKPVRPRVAMAAVGPVLLGRVDGADMTDELA